MTWFTGVYPSEHRMTNKFAVYAPPVQKLANLKELAPDLVTLADVLKQNGYATGGFTGNAGVSGGFGYEQGFDVYFYEKGKFGSIDQSIPRALRVAAAEQGQEVLPVPARLRHSRPERARRRASTTVSSTRATTRSTPVRRRSRRPCARKGSKRDSSRCGTRTSVSGAPSTTRRSSAPTRSSDSSWKSSTSWGSPARRSSS